MAMLTLRDRQTNNLFDPWEHLGAKRRNLLDRCWAAVFREQLLDHLPASTLSGHFLESFGRPSKDLHVVLGALVLQQLHDLTDAETVEAVAFNIAWHYALDIQRISDAYVCERTLRTYRRWVIEHGLDEELFKQLTDRLIQAFAVDTAQQRIDSTAVRSAMRTMTRLGILVDTVSKFLRELARRHPELHARVDREVVRRFVERKGGGCFAFAKPSESKQQLPEVARTLYELVATFRETPAAALESYQLLARVCDEQCETVAGENGRPAVSVKAPAAIPSDTVQNPSDPDASYNTHRGVGYLVQVMETYTDDEPADEGDAAGLDLITHIAVHKMTKHDSQALEPALDDVAIRGVEPVVILGDSHYGSTDGVQRIAERGAEVLAPAMPPKGYKLGRLTLEDFELDTDGIVVRCPAGNPPVDASVGKSKIEIHFDQSLCCACLDRHRCPGYANPKGSTTSRWQYTPARVAQYRRRLSQQSDEFKDRYRWRAGIEATMSRLKHQMGLATLRVRGKTSVKYVVFLRALGLNIRRAAAYSA